MKTKTFIYALFFTCILIGFNGCDKEDEFMQVREIAWSSLSEQEKFTVRTDWKNAEVKKETYKDEKVFAVTFPTTEDPLLGPIIVYISQSSLDIIGRGLRM